MFILSVLTLPPTCLDSIHFFEDSMAQHGQSDLGSLKEEVILCFYTLCLLHQNTPSLFPVPSLTLHLMVYFYISPHIQAWLRPPLLPSSFSQSQTGTPYRQAQTYNIWKHRHSEPSGSLNRWVMKGRTAVAGTYCLVWPSSIAVDSSARIRTRFFWLCS